MGKKRTAEEYHQTAEANGWVEGAHEEEDCVVLEQDGPSSRYKMNQQEALDQWIIFMSRKGISAAECLLPSWSARQGPNDTSVKNTMKKFFSGFERVTKTKIPDEFRTDIYIFVRETLVKEGYTTTKKREKFLFDDNDLENCMVSLWTEPDHVFIHEIMRSQITFLILAYCYTGARIGAYVHGLTGEVPREDGKTETVVFKGLTWKDVHIYLFPLPDGTTEPILKLTQRWVKNNKDPENHVSEVSVYEHPLLKFDCTGYLLQMAFRDGVLLGIDTPAQLWEQRVPEGDPLLELHMDPSKLDLPVLRTVTRYGGLSDRMLDESTFRHYFQQMVRNAGYYGVLTIHALRRALTNVVDKIATPGERNKLLGWASSDVCNKKYLDPISGVDGMGAFLGMKPRTDHIKKLRSASVKRAPGLPHELPAERMAEFVQDPKACELLQKLRKLRQDGAPESAIKLAERKFTTYRNWLKNRYLERCKADWLETRYENIIKSRGKISPDRSKAVCKAQTLFRIMPERARLADMIKSTEPRTREQKLQAVEDMLSLSTRNYEVMYRPGEEPVNGACPVCRSKLPEAKRTRADHIHACRRKEFVATVKARRCSKGSGPVRVEYCFLCFKWFDGEPAWERHCRSHLDSFKPTWCAVRIYCHTMISPGICPWCVHKEGLPATERLKQWRRSCDLMAHIDHDHIEIIHSWPAPCGCGVEAEDAMHLHCHLGDMHGLWKAEWKRFGVTEPAQEDEGLDDMPSIPSLEGGDETKPRKRRKLAKVGAKFIECSPSGPPDSEDPPVPGPTSPGGPKLSTRKLSQKKAKTSWTFVECSPPAKSDSPEFAGSTPPSSRCYPEFDEQEEEEGEPSSQSGDQSDDLSTGDFINDAFWLDNISAAEGDTADPISVSTPVSNTSYDAFVDLVDPALVSSEGPTPQPSSSKPSRVVKTPQSDEKVEFYLPSLESLNRNPTGSSSESPNTSHHREPAKPTPQSRGWVEVASTDGIPTLQELSDHEPDSDFQPPADMGEDLTDREQVSPKLSTPQESFDDSVWDLTLFDDDSLDEQCPALPASPRNIVDCMDLDQVVPPPPELTSQVTTDSGSVLMDMSTPSDDTHLDPVDLAAAEEFSLDPLDDSPLPSLEALLRLEPRERDRRKIEIVIDDQGPETSNVGMLPLEDISRQKSEHPLDVLDVDTQNAKQERHHLTTTAQHDIPPSRPQASSVKQQTDKCPRCGADVPRSKRRPKHLNFQQKKDFCEAHKLKEKLKAAKAEWRARGYPRISWRRLQSRIDKHLPEISAIAKGKRPSWYRSELQSAVTARVRSRNRCIDNASAGYYGPRGHSIMVSSTIHNLGPIFPDLSVKDRLIYTVGVAEFVGSVLIPELSTRLIQEDMKVGDKEAREILRRSARLGEILHEDQI